MNKQIEKVFAVAWLLVSVAFSFTVLNDACMNVNSSITIAPLISNFPLIFAVVVGVIPPLAYLSRKGS